MTGEPVAEDWRQIAKANPSYPKMDAMTRGDPADAQEAHRVPDSMTREGYGKRACGGIQHVPAMQRP
jgi:hypothetical protein